MIGAHPELSEAVREALAQSGIVAAEAGGRYDCVLFDGDDPGVALALPRLSGPVLTLHTRDLAPAEHLELVGAGAEDCLRTSELSEGRLEHAIRCAVRRHAVRADAAPEREQRAADALMAAVVSASHDPIWSVRIGGEVSSWNSGAEALLGYSADEIVGRNVRLLAPPERVAEIDRTGRRVRAGEVVGPAVTERLAKDGSLRPVALTVSPILDADGTPVGACAVARDLRPENHAQQELDASEERYRRILENAGEGIATVDAHSVVQTINERLAQMLGYTREELVGTPAFDLVHPDDVAAARERWTSTSEPLADIEIRYCRANGGIVWASVTRTRESSSNDRSWLVMVTDITARKEAEQDLAEREQRFRAIFDSAYDAILIADDDRRFVDVNPAACRIYGRSREEMLQLSIDEVADPAAKRRPEGSWGSFREGDIRVGKMTIMRPDGEVREIEFSSTPNISPHRHLSIVRDVTDRNASAAEGLALEHRLNQAERLETVGQLAGGVAHDFNNILSIIVNYAELARTARDDGSVRDDLAEISAAAARGRALTRQLLIVSQRDVARPEVFDLVELVRSVQSLLERVIGARIHIEVHLPDEPVAVSADRGRIDQLAMNLALNARDAMPAGGTLSISVRRQAAEAGAGPADVELIVADTGVGMIDVVAARAFEPFFTTKSAGQGVGLGLAAAHGIVTDAGGRISLESRLGEGTTVTVVLPGTEKRPPEVVSGPAEPAEDGAGRHILIVEDDATLREATRRVLERHGYATSTAESADAALVHLESSMVDVVLTDLVMPGMSGVALAQRLRVERPAIHVICMSGYSARRGMLPDDVTLLEKPFAPDELLAAVAQSCSAG